MEDVTRSPINYCNISTTLISASAASNESLFSCRFSRAQFFWCFIPCTHSLIPKKSGVRSGFKVKWMDFIVAQENKTIRAYSKASWGCQKDTEVGQQISLSIYTSEGVTGGDKESTAKTIKLSEKFWRK